MFNKKTFVYLSYIKCIRCPHWQTKHWPM